jgi:hypothetical protein
VEENMIKENAQLVVRCAIIVKSENHFSSHCTTKLFNAVNATRDKEVEECLAVGNAKMKIYYQRSSSSNAVGHWGINFNFAEEF